MLRFGNTTATWTSSNKPIGEYVVVNIDDSTNATYIGTADQGWTGHSTTTGGNDHWTITYPDPFTNPTPSPFGQPSLPPWGNPPVQTPQYVPFPLPVDNLLPPEDVEGRMIKAPPVSLEQILVEIAKVLKDRGDILEIREIFERYKLKLVDHDGEVIFDPKENEDLEDRGF